MVLLKAKAGTFLSSPRWVQEVATLPTADYLFLGLRGTSISFASHRRIYRQLWDFSDTRAGTARSNLRALFPNNNLFFQLFPAPLPRLQFSPRPQDHAQAESAKSATHLVLESYPDWWVRPICPARGDVFRPSGVEGGNGGKGHLSHEVAQKIKNDLELHVYFFCATWGLAWIPCVELTDIKETCSPDLTSTRGDP